MLDPDAYLPYKLLGMDTWELSGQINSFRNGVHDLFEEFGYPWDWDVAYVFLYPNKYIKLNYGAVHDEKSVS